MQGEIPACLCFGEGWLVMRVFLLTSGPPVSPILTLSVFRVGFWHPMNPLCHWGEQCYKVLPWMVHWSISMP